MVLDNRREVQIQVTVNTAALDRLNRKLDRLRQKAERLNRSMSQAFDNNKIERFNRSIARQVAVMGRLNRQSLNLMRTTRDLPGQHDAFTRSLQRSRQEMAGLARLNNQVLRQQRLLSRTSGRAGGPAIRPRIDGNVARRNQVTIRNERRDAGFDPASGAVVAGAAAGAAMRRGRAAYPGHSPRSQPKQDRTESQSFWSRFRGIMRGERQAQVRDQYKKDLFTSPTRVRKQAQITERTSTPLRKLHQVQLDKKRREHIAAMNQAIRDGDLESKKYHHSKASAASRELRAMTLYDRAKKGAEDRRRHIATEQAKRDAVRRSRHESFEFFKYEAPRLARKYILPGGGKAKEGEILKRVRRAAESTLRRIRGDAYAAAKAQALGQRLSQNQGSLTVGQNRKFAKSAATALGSDRFSGFQSQIDAMPPKRQAQVVRHILRDIVTGRYGPRGLKNVEGAKRVIGKVKDYNAAEMIHQANLVPRYGGGVRDVHDIFKALDRNFDGVARKAKKTTLPSGLGFMERFFAPAYAASGKRSRGGVVANPLDAQSLDRVKVTPKSETAGGHRFVQNMIPAEELRVVSLGKNIKKETVKQVAKDAADLSKYQRRAVASDAEYKALEHRGHRVPMLGAASKKAAEEATSSLNRLSTAANVAAANLAKHTVKELRAAAKQAGLSGYSKLKKADLIEHVRGKTHLGSGLGGAVGMMSRMLQPLFAPEGKGRGRSNIDRSKIASYVKEISNSGNSKKSLEDTLGKLSKLRKADLDSVANAYRGFEAPHKNKAAALKAIRSHHFQNILENSRAAGIQALHKQADSRPQVGGIARIKGRAKTFEMSTRNNAISEHSDATIARNSSKSALEDTLNKLGKLKKSELNRIADDYLGYSRTYKTKAAALKAIRSRHLQDAWEGSRESGLEDLHRQARNRSPVKPAPKNASDKVRNSLNRLTAAADMSGENLAKHSTKELRSAAKQAGLTGYSKLKKADLIEHVRGKTHLGSGLGGAVGMMSRMLQPLFAPEGKAGGKGKKQKSDTLARSLDAVGIRRGKTASAAQISQALHELGNKKYGREIGIIQDPKTRALKEVVLGGRQHVDLPLGSVMGRRMRMIRNHPMDVSGLHDTFSKKDMKALVTASRISGNPVTSYVKSASGDLMAVQLRKNVAFDNNKTNEILQRVEYQDKALKSKINEMRSAGYDPGSVRANEQHKLFSELRDRGLINFARIRDGRLLSRSKLERRFASDDQATSNQAKNLAKHTVKELRAAAKQAGLSGYSKLKKADLIEHVRGKTHLGSGLGGAVGMLTDLVQNNSIFRALRKSSGSEMFKMATDQYLMPDDFGTMGSSKRLKQAAAASAYFSASRDLERESYRYILDDPEKYNKIRRLSDKYNKRGMLLNRLSTQDMMKEIEGEKVQTNRVLKAFRGTTLEYDKKLSSTTIKGTMGSGGLYITQSRPEAEMYAQFAAKSHKGTTPYVAPLNFRGRGVGLGDDNFYTEKRLVPLAKALFGEKHYKQAVKSISELTFVGGDGDTRGTSGKNVRDYLEEKLGGTDALNRHMWSRGLVPRFSVKNTMFEDLTYKDRKGVEHLNYSIKKALFVKPEQVEIDKDYKPQKGDRFLGSGLGGAVGMMSRMFQPLFAPEGKGGPASRRKKQAAEDVAKKDLSRSLDQIGIRRGRTASASQISQALHELGNKKYGREIGIIQNPKTRALKEVVLGGRQSVDLPLGSVMGRRMRMIHNHPMDGSGLHDVFSKADMKALVTASRLAGNPVTSYVKSASGDLMAVQLRKNVAFDNNKTNEILQRVEYQDKALKSKINEMRSAGYDPGSVRANEQHKLFSELRDRGLINFARIRDGRLLSRRHPERRFASDVEVMPKQEFKKSASNLAKHTVKELRAAAKQAGLSGYSKLKKADLIEHVRGKTHLGSGLGGFIPAIKSAARQVGEFSKSVRLGGSTIASAGVPLKQIAEAMAKQKLKGTRAPTKADIKAAEQELMNKYAPAPKQPAQPMFTRGRHVADMPLGSLHEAVEASKLNRRGREIARIQAQQSSFIPEAEPFSPHMYRKGRRLMRQMTGMPGMPGSPSDFGGGVMVGGLGGSMAGFMSRSRTGLGLRQMGAFAAIGGSMAAVGLGIREFAQTQMSEVLARAVTRDSDGNVVGGLAGDRSNIEFNQLSSQIAEMAVTSQFSRNQLFQASRYMGMAGVNARDQLLAMPTVERLAVSQNMGLAQAADKITNIASTLGSMGNISGVADRLTSVASGANTNILQLSEAVKYGVGTGKAMGFNEGSMFSLLGLAGNVGMQGSMGGTGLRTFLSRLITMDNRSKDALVLAGSKLFDPKTGDLVTRDIGVILKDLMRVSKNDPNAIALGFRQRAGTFINGILEQLRSKPGAFAQLSLRQLTDVGILKQQADAAKTGLLGAFREMKSQLQSLAVSIGESRVGAALEGLVDSIGWAAGSLSGFIDRMNAKDPKTREQADLAITQAEQNLRDARQDLKAKEKGSAFESLFGETEAGKQVRTEAREKVLKAQKRLDYLKGLRGTLESSEETQARAKRVEELKFARRKALANKDIKAFEEADIEYQKLRAKDVAKDAGILNSTLPQLYRQRRITDQAIASQQMRGLDPEKELTSRMQQIKEAITIAESSLTPAEVQKFKAESLKRELYGDQSMKPHMDEKKTRMHYGDQSMRPHMDPPKSWWDWMRDGIVGTPEERANQPGLKPMFGFPWGGVQFISPAEASEIPEEVRQKRRMMFGGGRGDFGFNAFLEDRMLDPEKQKTVAEQTVDQIVKTEAASVQLQMALQNAALGVETGGNALAVALQNKASEIANVIVSGSQFGTFSQPNTGGTQPTFSSADSGIST